jgi:uncharacterized membrane protein
MPEASRHRSRARPVKEQRDQAMRLWFALGWPAFTGLIAVFMLMIAKPDLW